MHLPHSITIDMHAVKDVSGLTYLPRQDASYNGDIGQYSISVSMNGKHWSAPVATGTWADDKTLKTAEFEGVSGSLRPADRADGGRQPGAVDVGSGDWPAVRPADRTAVATNGLDGIGGQLRAGRGPE